MTKKDIKFIELARLVASQSQHKYYKIGAVLVRQGKVISIGSNVYKTHPQQISCFTNEHGSSIHAELNAIIGHSRHLFKKATIYTVRIRADNTISISRPCKSCISILKDLGIKKMLYSDRTGSIQEEYF